MSLCRAAFILSLYVSSMLHRISVLERARVLSHVALRLRQNRGTYRSTRRIATFFFPSPRTGHVCLILAVSPDRTISAPLPKGVGKTIARPLPIMLAVQRFVSNNRKAVGVRNRLDRIGLPKRKCLAVIMKSIQVSCFR